MTALNPRTLAEVISTETGLEFSISKDRTEGGIRWLELVPAGHPTSQTFAIRTEIGWRRLDIRFRFGNFAAELMSSVNSADEAGRSIFKTVLDSCINAGADVVLILNGTKRNHNDDAIWSEQWRSFELSIGKGMLAINEGDNIADMHLLASWTKLAAAAVIALLPVEESLDDHSDVQGFPEGAKLQVMVNRFERDRRNRAAALAIHGHKCLVCNTDMAQRYGQAAEGLIEVHHITPVSMIKQGYIINPASDLVPLCPNCHAVAHRKSPPYSVNELRDLLQSASVVDSFS